MSRIRGKNTRPELMLRKALYSLGLRYRLHVPLPGRPDVLITRARVAVFVDGAFWHGRDLRKLARELKVRRRFWLSKLRANVARDRRTRAQLRGMGYSVVRFWDDEVVRNPEACAAMVCRFVRSRLTKG